VVKSQLHSVCGCLQTVTAVQLDYQGQTVELLEHLFISGNSLNATTAFKWNYNSLEVHQTIKSNVLYAPAEDTLLLAWPNTRSRDLTEKEANVVNVTATLLGKWRTLVNRAILTGKLERQIISEG